MLRSGCGNKLRRHFPDRAVARQCLGWMPVGKTIKIHYDAW
jgi:hypothetical protein